MVMAEQQRHDATHVEAALAARQAAAEHQVVDVGRVERRDLVEGGLHDGRGEVVGTQILQRTLERAADRGPGGRNDHCLGHDGCLLVLGRRGLSRLLAARQA
jgi:hypothetical protein